MTITPFTDGWTVAPQVSLFAKLGGADAPTPVTLPHDALITQQRDEANPAKTAFFPSAAVKYVKTFEAPEEWRGKHVVLRFDGVYRDAMVFVNGALAANRANGYAPFSAVLDPYLRFGEENTIRVESRAHDDSRWYTGVGIHREVRLEVREPVHVRAAELHATTPEIDDDLALVDLAFPVDNLTGETRTVRARAVLSDVEGREVAVVEAPVTVLPRSSSATRLRFYLRSPERWSVERPYLYTAEVVLVDGEAELDRTALRVGVRTLRLDPLHGLRINGESVKLRGACIHHDNGVLGAAAFRDAEYRRVRLLKDAGFNAIRSSHNPVSEAMLDACDELGLLVMDETFDMWTHQKSSFDYSIAFPEWWERDVEALVLRDRNHASVIMYSIGNEIPETGDRFGAHLGRQMVERIRSLDPDRFVTNGVNGFVSVIDDVLKMMASGAFGDGGGAAAGSGGGSAPAEGGGAQFGGVNDAMTSGPMDGMNRLARSWLVTERTEESFAVLDVAGMNYGDARYTLDAEERPERIMVGSETYASRIGDNWPLVLRHPQVIGDFTWTGWDYLGEVGIGRPKYDGEAIDLEAPFPWLLAWCGDIDITGYRRPASYYREIVFGLRSEPFIAVRDPKNAHREHLKGTWAWSDSQATWIWGAPEGATTIVEVYSADEEIELLLDGVSLGRRPVGSEQHFTALFDVAVGPGDLEAVAYAGGRETARTTLRQQVGAARLRVVPEASETGDAAGGLLYVPIEFVDEAGTLVTTEETRVSVTTDGPAVLQALGSARPDNAESFDGDSHAAFRGRALAILRRTGPGAVRVAVSAEGYDPAECEIPAVE